ncbi:hypothetical protein CJJ17_12975 [Gordonia polyisoprenivorans]|nr:hypothetical protein CJJ17_12975 [Gordonia polyisoprenivorans]
MCMSSITAITSTCGISNQAGKNAPCGRKRLAAIETIPSPITTSRMRSKRVLVAERRTARIVTAGRSVVSVMSASRGPLGHTFAVQCMTERAVTSRGHCENVAVAQFGAGTPHDSTQDLST